MARTALKAAATIDDMRRGILQLDKLKIKVRDMMEEYARKREGEGQD